MIDINKDKLSHLLQGVIDKNKIVKIIPEDLDSFFKVCFILDNLNKIPQNANLWFVYLLSYINKGVSLEDISKEELFMNDKAIIREKTERLIEMSARFCDEYLDED